MTENRNAILSQNCTPEPTLRRLPWYLAYLDTLRAQGVSHVSSTTISRATGVDASQISKDLSVLGIKGKTRIGYDVNTLEHSLREFLGFTAVHPALLIGCGSLGSALLADKGLKRFGLDIVAGLDVEPSIIGTKIQGVDIYDIGNIAAIQRKLRASIAIITVPASAAQAVADLAVQAGLRAIWNFTPCRLQTPPSTVVTNTSIYAHLAVMYNRLS